MLAFLMKALQLWVQSGKTFSTVFTQCLELVKETPAGYKAWEERCADENLVKAMAPWLRGNVFTKKDISQLPVNFLSLWQTHWHLKMVFRLPANATDVKTYTELVKKKFWCCGRQGLVVLGVGLRWAW